jgi:succinoglycan biosynthesis protein ExoM
MNNIAVCIPTYKRPLMLEKLISSILASKPDDLLVNTLSIIVVDNDVEKTAEKVVSDIAANNNGNCSLSYFNYPIKGLSNVRNELLRHAFALNPDFIVSVDDDEYVSDNWLNELVKSIVSNNADIVRGPVLAVNSPKASKFISCWFKERERYPDNTQLFYLVTNNLIIRAASLKKYNLWFDPRFNLTGSEDTYFGIQVVKKGAKIFWAEKAIAYETIPASRASLKWLLKRIYRTAGTYCYCLRLEKKYLLLVKKTIVSVIYIAAGCLALTGLVLFNYKKKYWGVLKIAEGLGGFSGLLNVRYKEYKK